MKAIVTRNELNIGNGFFFVGKIFDVVSETKCFYILAKDECRTANETLKVNKKHMSIAGTSCNSHSVKVEVLND